MNCDASGVLRKRSMLWQHNIGIRPPHGFETQVLVCFSITAPSRKINTSFFRPVADLEEGLVKQLPDEQATARPKVFALICFFLTTPSTSLMLLLGGVRRDRVQHWRCNHTSEDVQPLVMDCCRD